MKNIFKQYIKTQSLKKTDLILEDENNLAKSLLEEQLSSTDMQYSLYTGEHFLSQISFQLYNIQDTTNYVSLIHNFSTNFDERNKGYGTILLDKTVNKLQKLQEQYSINIIAVTGKLDTRDIEFWKYTLPMYYKFSHKLFKNKPKCHITEVSIHRSKMYKFAMQLNENNKVVNFKFTKKQAPL